MDNHGSRGAAGSQSPEQKLAKGAKCLDLVTDDDRRFFESHKHRNHRLRPAAQIEIEQDEIVSGSSPVKRPGMRWFTLVKQFAPGMRGRAVLALPENTRDVSERECDRIFERAFAEIRDRGQE